MRETKALVLCPPNMTASRDGPNGLLGDRIHQLPAVAAAAQLYAKTYVWPVDRITRQVFWTLQGVTFIEATAPDAVVARANGEGVQKVFCLYADPSDCSPSRLQDCGLVIQCHKIAQAISSTFSIPDDLDPRGRVPLWRRLVVTVRPQVKENLLWPSMPFLVPSRAAQSWAEEYVRNTARGKPVLVVSPMQGGQKRTVEAQWWTTLAKLFHYGVIIVPVHESEKKTAEMIFAGMQNVRVIALDLIRTAALAATPGVHVLGVDGGTLNLLAAASPTGVLGIYGDWPASAWALPNVVVRSADISPDEAILIAP